LEESVPALKPASERTRGIDDALTYAVGHRIRIDALAILAEGRHSVSEVASILGLDVKRVSGHIRELYDCGCIEEAGTEKVRNTNQHFYRAVTLPYVSDEAYRAISVEARREIAALIIQAIMAETLASFRARKMDNDENMCLLWDCLSLDAEGKREVRDEIAASFERLIEIKARNANRLSETGETGTTTIVTLTGFERSRPGRPESGYSSPTKN
jgi:DNA-binding transcriptional ArsR family regulator